MTSSAGDPNGNIWITSKCHKEAEARYRRYDFLAVLLQVWLAGWMMYISVAYSRNGIEAHGVDPTSLNIMISGLLIAVSVLFWAFKLGETAAQHRDCYNKLDSLMATNPPDIQQCYRKQLAYYPNYSTMDYRKVLFHAWANNTVLRNREGVVSVTFLLGAHYLLQVAIRFIIGLLLFGFPVLLLFIVEVF